MDYITPVELKEKLDANSNLVLLDIREAYELEICNIGGVHMPMAEIASRADELDNETLIAVLCRSGKRAEAAANFLSVEAGKNAAIVKGGILEWIETVDNSLEAY